VHDRLLAKLALNLPHSRRERRAGPVRHLDRTGTLSDRASETEALEDRLRLRDYAGGVVGQRLLGRAVSGGGIARGRG